MLSLLRRPTPPRPSLPPASAMMAPDPSAIADVVAHHIGGALKRAGLQWRREPGGWFTQPPPPVLGARTVTVWVPLDPQAVPRALRPALAVTLAAQLGVPSVRVTRDGQYVRFEVPRPDGGEPVPLPRTGDAIARSADGRWMSLVLSDHTPHAIVAGQPGSGKTTACLAVAIVESRRARVVVINPKREPDYAPLAALFHIVAEDPDDIAAALTWARSRIGTRGGERVVVIIDEWTIIDGSGVTGGPNQRLCGEIASLGRSAHVHLVLGTQYPRGDIVDTATRTNSARYLAGALDATASGVVVGDKSATSLLGCGDMLLGTRTGSPPERVQVCEVLPADWSSAGFARPLELRSAPAQLEPAPAPRSVHPSQAPKSSDPDDLAWIIGIRRETGEWPGIVRVARHTRSGKDRAERMIAEAQAMVAAAGYPGHPAHPGHPGVIEQAAVDAILRRSEEGGMPRIPRIPGMEVSP